MLDMTSIGSVNSYIKNLKMKTEYNNKKKAKSGSEWVAEQQNRTDEYDKSKDKQLKSISEKLQRGERLTYSERKYLQKRDPQTYQKLVDTEKEQAQYEQQLKKCRTKDEVMRLKASRAAASAAYVNKVKNNPHITEEKKLEVIAGEQMKAAAAERTEKEFMKSGEYSSLPTEAEKRLAEKKLAEAEKAEMEERSENAELAEERIAEELDLARKTADAKQAESRPETKAEKSADSAAAKSEAKTEAKKAETEVKAVKAERKKRVPVRKITKAQAERSVEVRKTKRAKNRAGYGYAGKTVPDKGVAVRTLDIKA